MNLVELLLTLGWMRERGKKTFYEKDEKCLSPKFCILLVIKMYTTSDKAHIFKHLIPPHDLITVLHSAFE